MFISQQTCQKCGAPIEIGADGLPYCNACKVRLGYISFSLTEAVRPSPADFYQKQLDEPILETWVYETYGKEGYEYDDRDNERVKQRVESRFCDQLVADLGIGSSGRLDAEHNQYRKRRRAG